MFVCFITRLHGGDFQELQRIFFKIFKQQIEHSNEYSLAFMIFIGIHVIQGNTFIFIDIMNSEWYEYNPRFPEYQ